MVVDNVVGTASELVASELEEELLLLDAELVSLVVLEESVDVGVALSESHVSISKDQSK